MQVKVDSAGRETLMSSNPAHYVPIVEVRNKNSLNPHFGRISNTVVIHGEFDKAYLEELLLHLQSWLKTGSLEL